MVVAVADGRDCRGRVGFVSVEVPVPGWVCKAGGFGVVWGCFGHVRFPFKNVEVGRGRQGP